MTLTPVLIHVMAPEIRVRGSISTPIRTTGGSFVVGGSTAGTLVPGTIGAANAITYWGAQWSSVNTLSGGVAPPAFKGFANQPVTPPAFKGFANQPVTPACAADWTTVPGNSSRPPASVPAYTTIIVTGSVSKTGALMTGNTTHIVIVRIDPGYASNPGHAGTGVIVGVLC